MILVTGASGTTGSELVRQLTSKGHRVRVLLRNAAKRSKVEHEHVEIVWGDLGIPDSLYPAVEGVERVYLLSSADPKQAWLQGNLVSAAGRAGVKYIVKHSAWGADPKSSVDILRWHAETEKQIENSGMAWTHLRPQFFMQNFLGWAQGIAREGQFHASMGDAKIAMVDVRDVAAIAAAVLTGSGHEGRIYDLTGPEALAFSDAAEVLTRVLGRKIRYVSIPGEIARSEMIASGTPGWLADDLGRLFEVFNSGLASSVSLVVPQLLSRSAVRFEAFVRDYQAAFRERSAVA